SDHELLDGIGQLHAMAAVVQRRLLAVIAEYDRRELWRRDGCRHMGQWLAGHLGMTVSAGLRWASAAHALEDLPLISAALERGVLSLDKVLQLARFATPETEKELLSWSRRVGVNAIRHRADVANRPSLQETHSAHEDRYLTWWWCEADTRVAIEAMLPAIDGVGVIAALEKLAATLPAVPEEDSSREQRCADALVAMVSGAAPRRSDPERATVVVHAELEALGSDGPGCELEGGPVVHPELARRLSCDCRLEMVLGRGGRVVGIGRRSRTVPGWLMRELLHRDHGCTFPGCGTRHFVAAHHIVHWGRGGATDLDNLVLACSFHHKLVHEAGWGVELGDDRHALWRRPDGAPYQPAPPPSRVGVDDFRAIPQIAGFS
ncbi:MAG: HNH endonuclease, partial [Actinomycetota bacterium]|nr:HNH endonuclease [Actinomycetota bacterium]